MTDPQNHNPDPSAGHQPPYGQPYQGQQYGQPPPPGAPQYGAPQYGAPPQPYPNPPVKKKKKKWPWVLGALVALLIIVVAATSGGGAEDTDTTADSGASSAPQESIASEGSVTDQASTPVQATEPHPPAEPDLSSEQKNAVSKAKDYLSLSGFSKSGLIKQLEFEGFSNADATVAVDNLESDGDVNWNEQAAKKAGEYQAVTPMSRQGLVQQLEFEGFTPEQAAYGADNADS